MISSSVGTSREEVKHKELFQDSVRVCEKPTESGFTNCTAIVVYNAGRRTVLYMHLSPMLGNYTVSCTNQIVDEFLKEEGKKTAMIFGRTIDNTSSTEKKLKERNIPCETIKLPITDKLCEYRSRGIDLAWILKVHPESGEILLKDRSQRDELFEYKFPEPK